MMEYRIFTAGNPEQAEPVMNGMTQAGWRVVGTTTRQPRFQLKFVITLERESQNS